MNSTGFDLVAKNIQSQRLRLVADYSSSQRSLIEALYKACLRLQGEMVNYVKVTTYGESADICDKIYKWYKDHYVNKTGKTKNSGISKNITPKNIENASYHFDVPYEKRQFEKYLVKEVMPSRNEDFLAFILHVAVAFFFKTTELEEILQKYGFQRLNVRNIHHLAIYATLSKFWNEYDKTKQLPDSRRDNPFASVRLLYEQARDILNAAKIEAEVTHEEKKRFAEDSTQWIRDELIASKKLSHQNLLNYVKEYAGSFTMQHKTILNDHHKFASLFRYLFDKPARNDTVGVSESDFSFYAFTNQFCCAHTEKKFREKLFNQIDKNNKHPTRELMICFWLYACCFAYVDGVYVDKNIFDQMTRRLKQYNATWEDEIKKFYSHNILNVNGFLNGNTKRKLYFNGADVVDRINSKLREHYKWGMLDCRSAFDYYISQLENLEFAIDIQGKPFDVKYDGKLVKTSLSYPDALPCTLAVVFEFFEQLKVYEEYPLACKMYDQI